MHSRYDFDNEVREIEDVPTRVRIITCKHCNETATLVEPPGTALGRTLVEERFRAVGWKVANRRDHDVCPNCQGKQKAATCSKATPPRQPTPKDNRGILDELELRYDVEAGRYRDAFSDEALAGVLNVPRAWVTNLRAQLFGALDRNEAAEQRQDEIAKIKADLERLLQEAAMLETRLSRVAA